MPEIETRGPVSRRRLRPRRVVFALGVVLSVIAGLGWVWLRFHPSTPIEPMPTDPGVIATRGGTRFTPPPTYPSRLPRLRLVAALDAPGAMAIWGASGRDSRGHLWFATSAVDWGNPNVPGHQPPPPTARLYEYDPVAGLISTRGDAVEQLQYLGLQMPGELQQKIHSKFVEAPDGYLYFASSDETGADMSGSVGPKWASHLWRIRPGSDGSRWEHLLTTPESLIAVAVGGRHIYALGWFGHVLYRYDTKTGNVVSTRVGSMAGHISRNLVTDARGHAYVPRLYFTTEIPSKVAVDLVEFDSDLNEVAAVELPHYLMGQPKDSHGITGVQPMADGSIIFVTFTGYLYQITPQAGGPSLVTEIGSFHPIRPVPIETLFTYDGRRYLVSIARIDEPGKSSTEWLVYDLEKKTSAAEPFLSRIEPLPTTFASGTFPHRDPGKAMEPNEVSFYGCATRDDRGNFYVVGRASYTPVIVRIQPPGGGADEPIPASPTLIAESPRNEQVTKPEPSSPLASHDSALSPQPAIPAGPLYNPLESDAVPAPRPAAPADPWQLRVTFRRELKAILDAQGDQAAFAISELCNRSGRDLLAEGKRVAAKVATLSRSSPLGIERKVQMLRAGGVPEAVILDDLARAESALIGARNGPRTKADALVRSARRLVALPIKPGDPQR